MKNVLILALAGLSIGSVAAANDKDDYFVPRVICESKENINKVIKGIDSSTHKRIKLSVPSSVTYHSAGNRDRMEVWKTEVCVTVSAE